MDGDINIREFNERFARNKRKRCTDSQAAAADDTQDLGVILPSLSPANLIPLDLANEVGGARATKGNQ